MIPEHKKSNGSTLILVVVLMSILAITGSLFMIAARLDAISTKAVNQEKDLDAAIESIIAKLANELVRDTPIKGVNTDPNNYYDYPDSNNPWLASLEPYQDGTNFRWRQISDVTGYISKSIPGIKSSWDTQDIRAQVISQYPKIALTTQGYLEEQFADADGDGIVDSKWIELENVSTSTGKPIYAAVRVIDNGAMLNVNTAYKFDENETDSLLIDGFRVAQINLMNLAKGSTDDPEDIHKIRCDNKSPAPGLVEFNDEFAIRMESPDRTNTMYLPYDISDELDLRNRFILDFKDNVSRIETALPKTLPFYNGNQYRNRYVPITTNDGFDDWKEMMDRDDPDDDYSFRHILTTYNADRIIIPDGNNMLNINTASVDDLYNAFAKVLDVNNPSIKRIASQLAVNIVDYRDADSDVTVFNKDGVDYYGFEVQPFISEIAANIDPIDPTDPNNNAYALELYNPFNIPILLDDFTISISNGAEIPLTGLTIDPCDFIVITSKSSIFLGDKEDTSLVLSGNYIDAVPPGGDGVFESWDNYSITLKRTTPTIVLDFQDTVQSDFSQGSSFHRERDTSNWHVVYDTMNTEAGSLGTYNSAVIDANNYNLAIANKPFVTVGDVVRPLIIGPGTNTIGQQLAYAGGERDVRIDLASNDPDFRDIQQIFNYITVFDPPAEADNRKIYGRININTAPRFVIEQLPWMEPEIAEAIVAYRDKLPISDPNYINRDGELGFRNIGELLNVKEGSVIYSIHKYALESGPLGFPDLTGGDGAEDDFEKRDLIFARISNLVTVRSDVFTAYILVRLGADGPQRRMVAILDRSGIYNGGDKVRIIALHPVADPR
ncbi:MAG: hypothetical protein WCZ89_02545 [Phycisphaerae bacterium]